MIIDGVKRTSITVYNPIGNAYNRTVIHNCIWKDSEKAEFKNLGIVTVDVINIYIPYFHEYTEAVKRAGNIRLGNEKKVSYIVKGVCPFKFPQTEDDKVIQASIRAFQDSVVSHKVKSLKENTMGSESIWHVKVVV